VHELFHAVRTFFDQLAAVGWTALGIALLLHVLRLLTRVVAWRSILKAAYPQARVPLTGVLGGYLAGVGVNSVVPARGGDLVKLVIVKHRIEGSSYATLTPTLVVETLFDMVVAGAILGWALTQGVFPSLHALPRLPTIDWHWPLQHPTTAIVVGGVWLAVIALLLVIAVRRVREFRNRVRQGFAILGQPQRFFTGVITWQAASWVLRGASVYFCLRAFHVPATARNALLVLAVQSLSTLLPFSPGGIGTQQGFLVYVFRGTGIPRTALLSFSVGMQIAGAVVNAALGFASIVIMLRTVHWRQAILPEKDEVYARGP
jgi:glycosyltransferase 2 family protein